MVTYARAVDRNQAEIIEALISCGASVQTLQLQAGGVPDLLVGYQDHNYLMEVKTARGKLNPLQVDWFLAWRGQKTVVRNVQEALAVIGIGTGPVPVIDLPVERILRSQGNAAQQTVRWGTTRWDSRNPHR